THTIRSGRGCHSTYIDCTLCSAGAEKGNSRESTNAVSRQALENPARNKPDNSDARGAVRQYQSKRMPECFGRLQAPPVLTVRKSRRGHAKSSGPSAPSWPHVKPSAQYPNRESRRRE